MTLESVDIKQLSSADENFSGQLEKLLEWEKGSNLKIDQLVTDILLDVRQRGDDALVDYTREFDSRKISDINEL
ncbi:MAG: histidinol dehydrogenase, partial [Saprospiraceae bacterium]